jgi:hypothetical protein
VIDWQPLALSFRAALPRVRARARRVAFARALGDRLARLRDGRIRAIGPVDDLLPGA